MRPHGKYARVSTHNPEAFAQCNQVGKPAIVYEAVNLLNGKRYIGVTTRKLRVRRDAHLYCAAKGSKLKFHRALRKYGVGCFEFSILTACPSMKVALELERRLIAKFSPAYNITAGGEGVLGNRHSQSTRQRLWEAATTAEGVARWKYYSVLGPASMKKAVLCIKTKRVFTSAGDAALKLGISKREIRKACCKSGGQFRFLTEAECTALGVPFNRSHIWSVERKRNFVTKKQKQCKSVVCLDDDSEFSSITEAASYYGLNFSKSNASNAHICIKNGWRVRGHMFAYLEDAR